MTETDLPDRRTRARSAAAAWIGRPFGRPARRRADGTPASPRLSPRRALRLVATGAVGVALALGALWLAILYLPLPASQVAPRVVAALEARLGPDYAVTIADAELRRGGDGVELRLVDLAVARVGGPVLAEAPRVELGIDGLGLLTGEVKVRTVHVTRPRLDMQFDTTVGAASVKADLPTRVLAAAADLDRLLGPDGAAGALEEVDVTDATVLVAPRSRAPLALEGVDLKLTRGVGGALALTASSARSGDRWSTAVTVAPGPGGQGRVVDLGLENVDLAPYSAPFAEKAGAPPLAGRLSGHLNAHIGANGKLLAGDGRIAARGLKATLPGPPLAPGAAAASVGIDALQVNLGWDAAKAALIVEPSRLSGPGGQATFSGTFTAPGAERPVWSAALQGRDVLLAAERAGEPPLRLDQIVVDATFDAASGRLDVGTIRLSGPTAKAAASGVILFEGASPAIRLGLVSEPMPASAMKRLWPPFMARPVRAWAIENIASGTVDGLSLSLDIASGVLATIGPREALPPRSMALDVAFSNATLRGRPGLPWVEGATGRIDATARRVAATVAEGRVQPMAAGAGALAVSDVRFEVADTTPLHQKAVVTFKAAGALDPVLALVASGAVGADILPPQLDPSKVSGRIAADVTVGFELGHEPDPAPPAEVRVAADLSDVTIANVLAARSFEKGAFKLSTDAGRTELSGKGRVGGAPATVAVVETPATPTAPRARRLTATLTVEAADLTRLGLDVPGTLRGAVPLEAALALDQPGAPITVTADLTAVGIDGVVPGFKKPAGRAGKLGFVVQKGQDKTTIRDFALESGDRSVRGTIEFGPKGELLSATLPIYRPSPGDDARVEIDKTKSGLVKVAVQGAALDLKPLLDAFRGKAPSGGGAPASAGSPSAMPKSLDVTAKLGTGLGYGGEALAGLDLKIVMRDGKVTDADGVGRLGSGAIRLATAEDGRLKLTGDDAGAFFRLGDFYGRIDGGAFDLAAALTGGPGLLRVRNFSVRNEDTLEKVRRQTGADRAAAAGAAARGATRFDRARVAFVEGGGKIEVKEASFTGPTLGATLEGVVDYAGDRVALVGTFVPAYALNNLVSKVPIIGALLGGGEHGGLVGVTFQVKGPTASPTVTINPISAVAPGFLRKLFEFRQSGADATSSVPPNAPPAQ